MNTRKVALGAFLGTTAGLALAVGAVLDHPYLAPYFVILAAVAGVALIAIAGLLWLARRTRRFSALLLTAGIVAPLVTYAIVAIASVGGIWHERVVSLGPDVPANLVVLLREGAEDRQVFDFTQRVLGRPHPVSGTMLAEHVVSLLSVRVGGHQGFALQLENRATAADATRLRQVLQQQSLVWRVYENIAPSKIQL